MDNPIYVGILVYKSKNCELGYETYLAQHEPIIDPDVFSKVSAVLNADVGCEFNPEKRHSGIKTIQKNAVWNANTAVNMQMHISLINRFVISCLLSTFLIPGPI